MSGYGFIWFHGMHLNNLNYVEGSEFGKKYELVIDIEFISL